VGGFLNRINVTRGGQSQNSNKGIGHSQTPEHSIKGEKCLKHRKSNGASIKASVTNPTAAGRFLVAGRFASLPLIFLHRTGAVQNQLGRNAPHMSPFGCRPAAVVAQPCMGTASRAVAVVRQYGHF
jgi:hypothetical protein